jgi:hypothetical protein
MIHRLLKGKQRSVPNENPTKQEFSLGFSAHQSMDFALEQIIDEASHALTENSELISVNIDPQPIPNDSRFESPSIPIPSSIFSKKTISKSKTFRGLNNPLKVPADIPKAQPSSSASLKNSTLRKPIASDHDSLESSPQSPSFRLPTKPQNPSILAVRISIAKELLKSAASCQMISIQEAHSMGSKIGLPAKGLILPLLAELLHRSPDSVQKNLLLKTAKTMVPIDFFRALIGNQSVQKFHSLLIPYKIVPLFYRGNSLTILAEHPFLIPLAETLLKESDALVPWIHFVPATLQDLESFT